jgi:tRNA A-37 threonylcarbamoyl transferase component Bud32
MKLLNTLRGIIMARVGVGFGVMKSVFYKSSALNDILRSALREPIVRIRPILGPNGERLWLKRIEELSLRLRLQKGHGRRAFDNELRGLHVLAEAGLPVPEIVSEGPDHIVMSDVGPTLSHIMHSNAMSPGKRAAAFRAAGQALGRLHSAGFSHGRPAMRDLCWDGDEAHFIDLERFSSKRASVCRQALDVIVFVQTYVTEMGDVGADLDQAMQAYRAAAPKGSWGNVQRIAAWLALLSPVAAAAVWIRPRAMEFHAFPKAMAYIGRALD